MWNLKYSITQLPENIDCFLSETFEFTKKKRWYPFKDSKFIPKIEDFTFFQYNTDHFLFLNFKVQTTRFFLPLIFKRRGKFNIKFDQAYYRMDEADEDPEFFKLFFKAKIKSNKNQHYIFKNYNFDEITEIEKLDESTHIVKILKNSSKYLYKSYRLIDPYNPEPETYLRLNQLHANVPAIHGVLYYENRVLAMILNYVESEYTVEKLFLQEFVNFNEGEIENTLKLIKTVASSLVKLHSSLSKAFEIEKISDEDILKWKNQVRENKKKILKKLKSPFKSEFLKAWESAEKIINYSRFLVGKNKIQTHQDLHLGQMIKTNNDIIFFDFEGEPLRDKIQKKEKLSALRDVSSLLRSVGYLKFYLMENMNNTEKFKVLITNGNNEYNRWELFIIEKFLHYYMYYYKKYGCCYLGSVNKRTVKNIVLYFYLERAIYELKYELFFESEYIVAPIEAMHNLSSLNKTLRF